MLCEPLTNADSGNVPQRQQGLSRMQVARLLGAGGLPWSAEVTRAKMLALLMDWDAGHLGPEVHASPFHTAPRKWRSACCMRRPVAVSSKCVSA